MDNNTNKDKKEKEISTNAGNNLSLESNDLLIFFKKDKNFVFAHKKIGKLVAAIYLLTNQFQDSEPTKWDIRKLGLRLISLNVNLLKDNISIESLKKNLKDCILEIVSCFEIVSISGLISKMNLEILKREFFELLNFLNKISEKGNSQLNDKFFFVESQYERPSAEETSSYPSLKDRNFVSDDLRHVLDEKNEEKTEKLREFSTVAVKKSRRQSIIIALLKKKREVMIKDISPLVSDCSEKTIQRELQDLVKRGVLRKEGEKRWTKYSLV